MGSGGLWMHLSKKLQSEYYCLFQGPSYYGLARLGRDNKVLAAVLCELLIEEEVVAKLFCGPFLLN